MPTIEAERFRSVIRVAFRANLEPLEPVAESDSRVLDEVGWRFPPITRDTELSGLLPSGGAPALDTPPRTHLYLPTVWKGGAVQVPVLTWTFDFGLARPQASLYLALLQVPEVSGQLQALGLRFETPEEGGDGAESAHNYWHAQVTRGFTRERPLEDRGRALCPEWLPDSYPAFPLPATTPAELLVCVLISLYGAGLAHGRSAAGRLGVPREVWAPMVERIMPGTDT